MFVGVTGEPARTGKTRRVTANPSATEEAIAGVFDFMETSDSLWRVANG
jgi:hypothetical protein